VPIRKSPEKNSEIVSYLKFGTKIQVCNDCLSEVDTLDAKNWRKSDDFNCWVKTKYLDYTGFLFAGYLTKVPIDTRQDICLLKEGGICTEKLSFNPDLNWYAIYGNYEKFTIKKINVNVTTYKENCSEYEVEFCISTGIEDRSIFLLGVTYDIEEKKVTNYRSYGEPIDGFLYPGQRVTSIDYYAIKGLGCVNYYRNSIENYSIRITNTKDTTISQDLTKYMETSYSPSLYWDGDIDSDMVPDIVINDLGKYYLFLSKDAKGDEIVKEPVKLNLYNCH
jgi:hypothetical protein